MPSKWTIRIAAGPFILGATMYSAALALAETMPETSSDAFFAAVVAGFEAAARIAMAVQPKEHYALGFHMTPTCGVFGAAITSAKLLGLTADETLAAVGIAGSMAAGSMEFLADGAWTKRIHPGLAAQNGIQAALLAAEGFTGPLGILEGRDGFLHGYSRMPIPERLTEGLGALLRNPAHRRQAARLLPLHAGTNRCRPRDHARARISTPARFIASKSPCWKRAGGLSPNRERRNTTRNPLSTRSSPCLSARPSRHRRSCGPGSIHNRKSALAQDPRADGQGGTGERSSHRRQPSRRNGRRASPSNSKMANASRNLSVIPKAILKTRSVGTK